MNIPIAVLCILIGVGLILGIVNLEFGTGMRVTDVRCIGDFCTVSFSDGSSSTGPASQVQGKYWVGGCMMLPGREGICNPPSSILKEVLGRLK